MNNKLLSIIVPIVFGMGMYYENTRMEDKITTKATEIAQEEGAKYAIALFDCNAKIMESEELRTQDQISCREWACYDTINIICLEAKHPKTCMDKLAYACQKIYEKGH